MFRRLGIVDSKGKPVDLVEKALKILKIELHNLELKPVDEYMQQIH